MPAASSADTGSRLLETAYDASAFDSIFRLWVNTERTSASNVSTLRTAGLGAW